jgi:hypothetical protein
LDDAPTSIALLQQFLTGSREFVAAVSQASTDELDSAEAGIMSLSRTAEARALAVRP